MWQGCTNSMPPPKRWRRSQAVQASRPNRASSKAVMPKPGRKISGAICCCKPGEENKFYAALFDSYTIFNGADVAGVAGMGGQRLEGSYAGGRGKSVNGTTMQHLPYLAKGGGFQKTCDRMGADGL